MKYWFDADNKKHQINKMNTSHIINCMKMIERKAWYSNYRDINERKEVVIDYLQNHETYKDLEQELLKRVNKGNVCLGDFFLATKGDIKISTKTKNILQKIKEYFNG